MMLYTNARRNKKRKGAAMVEYALLVAGIALIGAGAVSLMGHKTSDMIGMVAAILPGAHLGDNGPVQSGHLIETGPVGTNGAMAIDVATIASETNQSRLGLNVVGGAAGGSNGVDGLIVESR